MWKPETRTVEQIVPAQPGWSVLILVDGEEPSIERAAIIAWLIACDIVEGRPEWAHAHPITADGAELQKTIAIEEPSKRVTQGDEGWDSAEGWLASILTERSGTGPGAS